MIEPFLHVSGWMFWIILAVVIAIDILILTFAEDDGSGASGFAVFISVAALLAAYFFTDAFAGVRAIWLVIGAALYVACAIGWSMKKWYDLLVAQREYHKGIYQGDPKNRGTLAEYLQKNIPTASDNKQQIVTWLTLWPLSFSWWVLTWPRRAFRWLYDRLSTVYDRIAQRVFAS